VLDRRIARKLRLTVEPSQVVAFGQTLRIDRATLPDLHIGSYAVGTVPAAVGDLSYLQGTRIDVILGLDVLARTSFSIDYSARQLSFAPSARESAVAPLRIVWPFVTVRLSVAGHPTQLLVDTRQPRSRAPQIAHGPGAPAHALERREGRPTRIGVGPPAAIRPDRRQRR
jgi:hypothetical protein